MEDQVSLYLWFKRHGESPTQMGPYSTSAEQATQFADAWKHWNASQSDAPATGEFIVGEGDLGASQQLYVQFEDIVMIQMSRMGSWSPPEGEKPLAYDLSSEQKDPWAPPQEAGEGETFSGFSVEE